MPLFNANIDLDNNQLQNAVVHSGSSKPGSPSTGQIFYDTDSNQIQVYTGSDWEGLVTETKDSTTITDVTSILNSSLVVGRDAHNQIKFSTDDQIIFRVGNADGVTFKASGEIEATSLDISGNADIAGDLTGLDNITSTNFVIGGHTISDIDIGTEFEDEDDHIMSSGAIVAKFGVKEGSSSIVTTGALNSGSITSGFGNINNGSSTITTTGAVSTGSLTTGGAVKFGASAANGVDVSFYTAGTAAHVGLVWDADGATEGMLIGGADDHGIDFKFFGESEGKFVHWDMSGDELVLGSSAKISFNDAGGGENIVASSDGHLEVNAGTTLDMTAPTVDINASTAVTIDGPAVTITSSTSAKPVLTLSNTNADANSAELKFNNDTSSGADNDVMGKISFYGTDAAENTEQELAYIDAIITDSAHGSEAASLRFYVAENDGTRTAGLTIAGQADDDGEVDVTIGAGSGSTTTIAGNLQVNGTTTTVNQTIVENTVSVLVFEGANDDAHETTLKVVEPTADCSFSLPTLTAGNFFLPAIADTATDASAAVTAAEFALLDGGSTVGTTAVANGDGIFTNDGGTMRHTTVQTFQTYFDANSVGGSNIVTTGALNSGSITSGFGNINNGSSTITTTGLISGGSLDIDDVLINGTTIGHTDDTDLMTVADGLLTVAGEISVTTLDIGGTNVSATAAELNVMDGDTSATSTTIVDADRVVVNDAGTMKQVTVAQMSTYYQAEEAAAREKVFVLDNGETNVSSSDNITYDVTHNFSSRNVMVEVYRNGSNSGNYQTVYTDVTRHSDDVVRIVFGSARTAGDYTAILRKIG